VPPILLTLMEAFRGFFTAPVFDHVHCSKLKQAREELKRLPPEQREELRWNGIGPGDSYAGMWRMLNRYRRRLEGVELGYEKWARAVEEAKPGPNREAARYWAKRLEEEGRYLSEQIISLYGKLIVHEKPRLQSIEVKGDPSSPIDREVDLKGLSDVELSWLGRILPKLGGATDAPAQFVPPRKGKK
jgi:hypothetical protein